MTALSDDSRIRPEQFGGGATDQERELAARTLPRNGDGPGVDPDLWLLHVRYAIRPGPELRRRLVEEYRGYALAMARRMHREGEPLDDLRQVAFEALLLALERFDPERGCPFLGFASLTIAGALKRHYRDLGWLMRVPRRVHELVTPIRRATDDLTVSLRRRPTTTEIAERVGVDVETVLNAQDAAHARSMNPLPALVDEPDAPRRDTVGAEDPGYDRTTNRIDLARALAELDEDDRELVRAYYFDDMTQTELAERLDVSQMQVSRLLRSVLRRLESRISQFA